MHQPFRHSLRVISPICVLVLVLAACRGRGATPTAALTEASPQEAASPQAVPTSPTLPANPTPAPETDPLGLMLRWRISANDTVWNVALTDLTGGGVTDLIVSSHDKSLYALDSAGTTYWSVQTGGPIYALALGDLDGDRQNEILVGGDDQKLRAIRADGSEMWQHSEGTRITAAATGDLDRDGQDEVVLGVWSGEVVALDGTGSLKWRALVPGGPTALTVADIDRDRERRPEIIVATEQGAVLALDVAGHRVWAISDGGYIRQIALADLEPDGAPEVIVGTREGQVLAIGGDGKERWRLGVDFAVASLAVTDLDHDNLPDILAGGGPAPGSVVAILPAGVVRWTAQTPGGVLSLAGGDLDQDGKVEVLAGGDDGFVSLFDPFGKLRGTYPTASRVRGIRVADLDAGGPPEVIVNAGDNVYVLSATLLGDAGDPRPADPPTLPEARHDLMFESPDPGTVELLFVGDVTLAKSIADRAGPFGPSYPFDATRGLLNSADLTVLNLTSPLTRRGTPADKPLMYRAAPEMADGLQAAGFDVAMLANGHAMDYGQVGLTDTRQALSERGTQSVGAGSNLGTALQPLVIEVKGVRIVFLAFTNGATGDYATDLLPGVAPADVATVQRAVSQVAITADVVVVGLNTGNEYAAAPQEADIELAHAAIDAGATLVIGTGAHLTQNVEVYGDGFIAYNVGNFVSDVDTNNEARNGAILRAVVTPVGLRTVDLIPIRIVADAQPRVLNDGTGHAVVQRAFPEGELYSPPAASAVGDPGDVPNYSLAVALDYPAHLMRVTQSITLKNTTPDIWQEVVLSVPPSIFEDVFILRGMTITRQGETSEVTPDLSDGFLRANLPLPLAPGEVLTLGLNYNLRLPPVDPRGWPPEGSLGFTADLVQAGDWYPVLAPYRNGEGWQTWAAHAVGDPTVYPLGDYDLSVQADEEIVVAGGGFAERQGNVWRFHLENARGVAFAASPDYQVVEGEADGIQVRSYYLPDYADAGQGALEAAIQALGLYEELYGPYPYNDLVVAQNGYFGAMEYSATASVSGFAYVTYGDKPESLLVALVAHEVAHQWWYGGVGNDQVNEPWLDEAFAMYSEHLFYERLYPDALDWWQEERVDKLLEAGQPVPIDTAIYDYASTRDLVYSMYGQAARFMDELRELMGDEAFFAFLQDYYQTNTGRIVTAQDFFDAVRRHTDANLNPLLERYFSTAQP
jgi:poly-gamma-glutamate capsule biosynthesis protein CapA/YwtB (metallophosphatase superfamily)